MARWIVGFFTIATIATLLVLSSKNGGVIGLILGAAVIGAVGLRVAAYFDILMLPPAVRRLTKWTIFIGLAGTLALWIGNSKPLVRSINTQIESLGSLWQQKSSPHASIVTTQTTHLVSDKEWTRVVFPRAWFTISPEKPIVIRLANGERFIQLADGRVFKNGREVEGIGDNIPGSSVYLRARDRDEKPFIVTIVLSPK